MAMKLCGLLFLCGVAVSSCARVNVKEVMQAQETDSVLANSTSSSSSSIVIFVAAHAAARRNRGGGGGYGGGYGGGAFSGGYYGGRYAYSRPAPPKPPKWTKLPIGCQPNFNFGLCEATLLQKACEAKHPNEAEVTAEAACNKAWPKKLFTFGSGREPFNMYCLAAAADTTLQAKAAQLVQHVPEDPEWCKVSKMEYLRHRSDVRADRKTPAGRISHAETYYLLQRDKERDGAAGDKLVSEVDGFCENHISAEPKLAEYGFCRSPLNDKGVVRGAQDCDFFWGLRAKWGDDYGEEYCNSLAEAGKLRCLAFRKQIIRVAQASSSFGTAKFHKFDEVFRMKKSKYEGCPSAPADAPSQPASDEVEDAELAEDQNDDSQDPDE